MPPKIKIDGLTMMDAVFVGENVCIPAHAAFSVDSVDDDAIVLNAAADGQKEVE